MTLLTVTPRGIRDSADFYSWRRHAPTTEGKMRDFVWLALGVVLFLAWGISYIVFHVPGVLIHVLLVFALLSIMLYAFIGNPTHQRP